jgi:hypothetical protein
MAPFAIKSGEINTIRKGFDLVCQSRKYIFEIGGMPFGQTKNPFQFILYNDGFGQD